MRAKTVERDERTVSVENASYRWAFLVLVYGVLVSIIYRGYVYRESAWDLMALVIVSGGIANAYQASGQILSKRWLGRAIFAAVAAGVVAAIAALAIWYKWHLLS
jgi:hypothetical protein